MTTESLEMPDSSEIYHGHIINLLGYYMWMWVINENSFRRLLNKRG